MGLLVNSKIKLLTGIKVFLKEISQELLNPKNFGANLISKDKKLPVVIWLRISKTN